MDIGGPFRLLDVLSDHDVPFVVIGGHAVTYHGYVRATEDTDVVFQRTPESEAALLGALSEVNACWIGNEIDPNTGIERTFPVSLPYVRGSHIMMLVTDFGFLDVFDHIPGHPDAPVEQLFQTAIAHQRYKFVSLAWLRAMKTEADRPKDRLDLEHLPGD